MHSFQQNLFTYNFRLYRKYQNENSQGQLQLLKLKYPKNTHVYFRENFCRVDLGDLNIDHDMAWIWIGSSDSELFLNEYNNCQLVWLTMVWLTMKTSW